MTAPPLRPNDAPPGTAPPGADAPPGAAAEPNQDLAFLTALERKVLWLSTWMIHHANHLRPGRDGLKVGGHQASCASAATLMTALYFKALRPEDRVAVKPHASPVFHAIQYLLGNQSLDALENFRALGGAQAYPSRTKDTDGVDFSTGSVGLGAAMTTFSSLVQDYLGDKGLLPAGRAPGRMIALVGDAELDEGNIYEALLEAWKHNIRNNWWIIDYNRQSLDGVVDDRLFRLIGRFFRATGWQVVTLKYGKRLKAAFALPGGRALKQWINDCPNDVYSALTFQGGAEWRAQITADVGEEEGVGELLGRYDDDALHDLMTNLGGHDMQTILEAFESARDDVPTCFIAYTVKGYGLPLAGHRDNHSGLMNHEQVEGLRQAMNIARGAEWERFAGLDLSPVQVQAFLDRATIHRRPQADEKTDPVPVPALPVPEAASIATQVAFGRILQEIGRGDSRLAERIVTTSPDVAVSTNLGPWINRRGIYAHRQHDDVFKERKVVSAQKWAESRDGQHVELGIAENSLFLTLAAFGLSEPLFGVRLLPIGTLYDPFISRGLDALNYACYQDARFMLVATPSGISLAPEGGAHQSTVTPLIGIGQPGLASFEPAFADELAEIMRWGFEHMQAPEGGSVYLRLSTRPLEQPVRTMDETLARHIVAGGYWAKPPQPGADRAIIYMGCVAAEAIEAHRRLLDRHPGAGLLAVTSADRLYAGWRANDSHMDALLDPLAPDARLVTVLDGHPSALAWMGSVRGQRLSALGVERFGQCGDIPDLFRAYGIDADAIAAAGD